jgi:hypothetical protein
MKREASSDAWLFSIKESKWSPVSYAPGDVPRVRAYRQDLAAHAYVQVLMCALACEDCKILW